MKSARAKLPDRAVQLGDRTRDVAGQRQGHGKRRSGAEKDQHHQAALDFLRGRAQAQHLTVGDQVADRQHFIGVVGEFGREPPDLLARSAGPRRGRGGRIAPSPRAPPGRARSAARRRGEVREARPKPAGSCDARSRSRRRARFVRDRALLGEALDRADPVHQRAAGARRLRGAVDGAAALLGEALGIARRNRRAPPTSGSAPA